MKKSKTILWSVLTLSPLLLASCGEITPIGDLYKEAKINLDYDDSKGYLGYSVISYVNSNKLTVGATIEITASGKNGYELETLTFNGTSYSSGSRITLKETTNYLIATFKLANTSDEVASITLNYDSSLGSVKLKNETLSSYTEYKVGNICVLEIEANDGYKVSTITFNGSTILSSSKITLVSQNVFNITFVEKEEVEGTYTVDNIKTTYLDVE